MNEPQSTRERTLLAGAVAQAGAESAYRHLRWGRGEQYSVRSDFAPVPADPANRGRRLLRIGHVTDLHIADAESPLRLDFASRDATEIARWNGAVTYTHRPYELATVHAAAAMIDTLSRAGVDIGIVTGDSIDNAQLNELTTYLDVAAGGTVGGILHGRRHAGIQSADWSDQRYWQPEGDDDEYKRRAGYPTIPGYLEAVARPFTAPGFASPWLSCLGNHDLLVGGTTSVRDELTAIATGGRKPIAFPDGWAPPDPLDVFLRDPAVAYAGPAREITADETRRLLSTADFVREHRRVAAREGSTLRGFTEQNERQGTAYYAYDASREVRVIVLDTNHRQGHWDGSIDRAQLEWLREQLAGLGGVDDPYVVLASHHATPSINNNYGVCADTAHSEAYANEILALALECPRVVLWLNGHHHANRIAAHFRPGGGGFFEVTTTAIVDSPGQARVLDLWERPDGTVEVISTMYDADVPLVPDYEALDFRNLASLHREVAANERWRGAARQGLGGLPTDRNARMLLPRTTR